MKELKCVKCKSKFETPDDFYGEILCEGCDPRMQKSISSLSSVGKYGKIMRASFSSLGRRSGACSFAPDISNELFGRQPS